MAESDKGDTDKAKTSTDTAKKNSSLLDEDISKDFLSSWKSMPVTGGSDMDFNFEPVAKGNKKAFDFDMDMDFSLDDAFGKISSFKLDMPDIDFSSSPKKSSISREKKSADRETTKESHQDKNDKFNFSFDFDGLGDFNLDEPAVKDRKNATEEKSSKQAADNSSLYKIESEDSPNEAATSREPKKEDASHTENPNFEVAVNSNHGPLVEEEPFVAASNSTIAVNEQEEIHISVNKPVSVDGQQLDHESPMAGETDSKISKTQARAHDFSSNPESSILPMLVASEEANASPEANGITTSPGMREDFYLTEEKTSEQVFAEVKDQVPLVKVSEEACASSETNGITIIKGMEENVHLTEKKISEQAFDEANKQAPMVNASGLLVMDSETPDDELCSANEKIDAASSEVGPIKEQSAAGALSSTDAKTATPNKSSTPCLTEKMSLNEDGKVVGAVEKMSDYTLTLDTLASPASRICKTMKSEVSLNAKLQKSDEKNPPTPADSEPPSTKSLKTWNKLCGANNFFVVRGKTDGDGTKHLTLEKNNRGSTLLKAVDLSIDLSNEGNGQKMDDHLSSYDKDSTERESAAKRREKSADVSRAGGSNGNEEIQAKMVVDAVPSDGHANRDSFRLLDRRKKSIDVKPSSIQLPSVVAPQREVNSINQGHRKPKDKISSLPTIQRSNVGQANRLLSDRSDSTVISLPSLRISSYQLPSLVAPQREVNSINQGRGKLKDKISSMLVTQGSHVGKVDRLLSARSDTTVPSLPSSRLSSIQLPSLVAPQREVSSINQGRGKLNDKFFSLPTIQRSNVGQVNRLSSARSDTTVPTLPSLRISRNIIKTNTQSSSVQDPKSLINLEKSARLQEKPKTLVSPLKRKPTEAADLHPSKRHSLRENRMSKVSTREAENEVQTLVTLCEGIKNDVPAKNPSPKFDFHLEENLENLDFTLMESDENAEKAEVCAKELDDICIMLKKKHDEAKELLVRALVNNNLLMLNYPLYEEKILKVQKFASRLLSREQETGV